MNYFGIENILVEKVVPFVRWNIFERILDAFGCLLRMIIIDLEKSTFFN